MSAESTALWALAGGEEGLRPVLRDFYERVFADTMIGFFFRNADKERLIQKELELCLELLGAETRYTGRPLDQAHGPHRIMGGQFMRRLTLLKETLEDHDMAEAVVEALLAHSHRLRDQITPDRPDECRPRS